jgi:hypothetical protein
MNPEGPKKSPLEKFESFVSEILTVTKEDIQKAEREAEAVIDAERPAEEVDDEPC